MSEPKPKTAKLPCGCEVDMNADGTIYGYQQDNLGLEILQCKQCKLIVGLKALPRKRAEPPLILSPFGKVARG